MPSSEKVSAFCARNAAMTSMSHWLEAFRQGLKENGFVEGQNVTIDFHWAEGRYDRLPGLAADLVQRHVAVIVTTGGEPGALAAHAATKTIPIVFSMGTDPVKLGLISSYNQPGGNVTGVNILAPTLEAKRLALLHQLLPSASTIGVLLNAAYGPSAMQSNDIQEAARAVGVQIQVFKASTDAEIETAFEAATKLGIAALAVAAAPFFDTRRVKLIELAARLRLPAMYQFREYAVAGGLMSYGVDLLDGYRQVGAYTGKILNGAKPSELPVMQPTKFQFVVNLKSAKALGLSIPPTLLALADEVIE